MRSRASCAESGSAISRRATPCDCVRIGFHGGRAYTYPAITEAEKAGTASARVVCCNGMSHTIHSDPLCSIPSGLRRCTTHWPTKSPMVIIEKIHVQVDNSHSTSHAGSGHSRRCCCCRDVFDSFLVPRRALNGGISEVSIADLFVDVDGYTVYSRFIAQLILIDESP